MAGPRIIRAPRGTELNCKGWQQEAALRMLMNNLDPDVAKDPDNLIVYGGTGRACRSWNAFDAIVATLKKLENDETLLMQSGKPVGVFKTHKDAPRVLITNSLIVPAWATWENFRELVKKGLTVYGQMTAGSWIYIGTQGILQGTYETFGAVAKKHFQSDLKGKFILTAGLGEMGGAQPLAVTMNNGVALAVEVDESHIKRRLDTNYCQQMCTELDEALELITNAKDVGTGVSVALLGNAAEIYPELVKREIVPDVVTDQTAAHDPLNGYVPAHTTLEAAEELRKSNPNEYIKRAKQSMKIHVKAMLDFQKMGSIVFDYGNNIRQMAFDEGLKNAFDFSGFVPAYIRPLFCEGKGPFRWVALSGDPKDIYTTDEAVIETFPENKHLAHWIKMARDQIKFQGLPARICWLGYGERARFGKVINDLVHDGEVEAPIVIGRDHLDCGSVASPNRETEGMKDGSDAIADWPILNALINTAGGATWVSVHQGGGVGIPYSIHSGMVIVADGTKEAEQRLERVLTSDPGMGILRHTDAGYQEAIEFAKKNNIRIPMLEDYHET